VEQHKKTGVDSHHWVRTSETNGAHTGYTTNKFVERVKVHEIGETLNRGAEALFWPCNNT
jgi:hypothetical protein